MRSRRKKLIAGIVLTGGGAQLQHLKQLVEYITGMDTRIGYPNEHLAGNSDSETTSPLYATAVGLVLNSLEQKEKTTGSNNTDAQAAVLEDTTAAIKATEDTKEPEAAPKEPKKFFDKWAEKFKEFLDNAE